MKHRQNGTAFPSAVILTLCAVEFNAADTDTSGSVAASSRRRKFKPHKNTDESRVKVPCVLICSDTHKKLANQNFHEVFLSGF